ncbi:glycoside hydrolase family 15 protein [Couchioplanes caeruleus]|uniref:Glucoamylase n=2 Tax=Couchioplanes caeruleus TaxID=56438 RepID=A0A1K0GK80_9ACTN|nr:glycoside hydrolase family 15 protein [Couchioplanes caeruleus]OJF12686.1 glucoamylase [Couchioplanes caeruleus subsp. caeruleus]ROP28239.1 GH15 family glucan-1,4-alpha-glucosidase [Couchioplanes caeruleus]
MSEYPLIADHGLIGDLQTAALVATDGTVDWFCAPRFDSPSIFGALLDHGHGGHCRIRPTAEAFTRKQLYIPGTAVLVTRFLTEAGVGEVVDFMPVASRAASESHRLVRTVRCVRGRITFDVEIAPRFDYGRERHQTRQWAQGVQFRGDRTALTVDLIRDPDDGRETEIWVDSDGDVHAEVELVAGETRGLVLDTGVRAAPRQVPTVEARRLFDETVGYWKRWLAQSTYAGRWRETLHRSAITLKLMTYAPSGGLVAAPTAALPEQVGGERNWDYRYTWVRDASFSVYSLLGMGFREEAAALGRWLRERVEERVDKDGGGPLNIMYRIDGSSDLTEETLDHWEGYRGSGPVRIGNGAAGQLQLDIYGEALDSIYVADRHGQPAGHQGWRRICDVLDWLTDNWDQPEEGIWETRGGRQDFTYGRLMCWVAFDRGIRLATAHGRPAAVGRWRAERDAVYDQIMTRGWSQERRAFRQHYDTDVLDSALLRMPRVGFVTPTDPMWLSTLAAMDAELVTDSLVYRYDPAASPDGLRGSEGTFSLCTFAYVDALSLAGQVDRAQMVFEKMLTYANHLGLYSEEIALTGEQVGNFPQAFTHLALIDAAISLNRRLDRRAPDTT